jgi:hypothetical protein
MDSIRRREIVVVNQVIDIFVGQISDKVEGIAFLNFIITATIAATLNGGVIFVQV